MISLLFISTLIVLMLLSGFIGYKLGSASKTVAITHKQAKLFGKVSTGTGAYQVYKNHTS